MDWKATEIKPDSKQDIIFHYKRNDTDLFGMGKFKDDKWYDNTVVDSDGDSWEIPEYEIDCWIYVDELIPTLPNRESK